jgi:enoyl-CoA hydratase/carnithine racemase
LTKDLDGAVLILTLNRPEARNALSEELMGALQTALDQAAGDNAVKVVVIAANGPAFCAGHDLKQMTPHMGDADKGRAYFEKLFAQCSRLMLAIVHCPKPVIAQVHGVATAAGCQLVATCDLAIAAETAQFATPGVKIGLFCTTPMLPLSRAIGRKKALEMLMTGRLISADEAEKCGLINKITPEAELDKTVMDMASQIAEASPLVLGIGKQAFYNQIELDEDKAYEYASNVMALNLMADDAQIGIQSFLDKKKPVWTGK